MDYLAYKLSDPALQELADPALLSGDERAAAEKRGARYVLARCLLRRELARRLGVAPQDIRFHYGEKGKPACAGIEFNLSHSGDWLALAFDRRPVGIDIERVRPRPRLDALAERIMCPAPLAAIRERGCPKDEFYACWCAAEALVKQAGASIWQAADFPFAYAGGCLRPLRAGMPALLPFTPAAGYAGAVAYFP